MAKQKAVATEFCDKCKAPVIWLEIEKKDGERKKHIFDFGKTMVGVEMYENAQIWRLKMLRVSHWQTCKFKEQWWAEAKAKHEIKT